MIRKILMALGCLGIIIIAMLAGGTYFVAREAKDMVKAKVDEEVALKCKARRAEYQDAWNRAVDSGRFEQMEDQLNALERDMKAICAKT
jgi:hypothetical protein